MTSLPVSSVQGLLGIILNIFNLWLDTHAYRGIGVLMNYILPAYAISVLLVLLMSLLASQSLGKVGGGAIGIKMSVHKSLSV